MPPHIRRGRVDVPAVRGVVLLVGELPQQVEAVQLVKHLDGCAVADFPCLGVGDLKRVRGEAELVDFFEGYGHVADCLLVAVLVGWLV